MATYRTRPVELDAIRWTGDNIQEVYREFGTDVHNFVHDPDAHSLLVSTPDGRERCYPGDWLIRSSRGRFETCGDAVFQDLYEAVDVLKAT